MRPEILYVLNVVILTYIGINAYRSRAGKTTLYFLLMCLSYSIWEICVLLFVLIPELVNLTFVARLQLLCSIVFFNSFLCFCYSYPESKTVPLRRINALISVVVSVFVLFSDTVTRARLSEEKVVFDDGFGFIFYSAYVLILAATAIVRLITSFLSNRNYRKRLRALVYGLSVSIVLTSIFHIILPAFGNFDYLFLGYITTSVPPYAIAYSLIKQNLLDYDVAINRTTAWFWVLFFAVFPVLYLMLISEEGRVLSLFVSAWLAFWVLYGGRVHQFVLTTARRTFVKGWYDDDVVLNEVSSKIFGEMNGFKIFSAVADSLDKALEPEELIIIVARRGDDESVSEYAQIEYHNGTVTRISVLSPEIDAFKCFRGVRYLSDCDAPVREYLEKQGLNSDSGAVVISFHSPDMFEGTMVLGGRSGGAGYKERDLRLLRQLFVTVSGVLYRLTPFEKLEQRYRESKERLHNAEIQLLRAEKIQSIAHATRQAHHEIRTPLNIIKLGLGRVKSMGDFEAYKDTVESQIKQAMEVVEETLLITDLEKESIDRLVPTDVGDVVLRALKMTPDSQHMIHTDLSSESRVLAVQSDLQVVFINLVRNALEAMPNGGRLDISTRDKGDLVEISFQDTGVGIEKELQSKIWEPYFSGKITEVGNSTARRGWGLTIVNRIVTEHKGTISVESEVGVGTTFYLRFPKMLETERSIA